MVFDIEPIKHQIERYQSRGLKLFVTSSFQSQSLPLLHVISRIDRSIPVYFLNTGYHFPETMQYKEKITGLLDLNVINLSSSMPKSMQKDERGRLLFASDPDYCCYLNKVQPLEPVLSGKDVWISGVRKDQNTNRRKIGKEEKAPQNTIRYHPMLDVTGRMIDRYIAYYDLPRHPLDKKGYKSISCEPCTQRITSPEMVDERDGRWKGMTKTECGLHTELLNKGSE